MKQLDIKPTDTTPSVEFDLESSTLTIAGESFPENVTTFYDPILKWIKEYFTDGGNNRKLVLNLNLKYFNTSTSKYLFDIMSELEETHKDRHADIRVVWCYKKGVEIMYENGEEFAEDFELPFEFVAYE